MNATPAKSYVHQNIHGHAVTIMRCGPDVGIRIDETDAIVPADIASIAAGPDAWLRDVLIRCTDCKTPTPVGTLEGYRLCPCCYEKVTAEFEEG